jgi:hypothetical protein
MKTIYLISCSYYKTKKQESITARQLYSKSYIFKAAINYAEYQKPDSIFILSAKYKLISPDSMVDYYNLSLNDFSKEEKDTWANDVLNQLKQNSDIKNDHFFIIASPLYYAELIKEIKNYTVVAKEHTSPGRRARWLKTQIGDYSNCSTVDNPIQVSYAAFDKIYSELVHQGAKDLFPHKLYIQEAINRGVYKKTAIRKYSAWKKRKICN